MHKHIILFDGVCNFCNSSINFVIERDKEGKFLFAPLQSQAGEKLQQEYKIKQSKDYDSVILIKNKKVYKKSSAALEIARDLGVWKIVYFFKIVPWFIRDLVYDLVAKNRYRLFGKKESCRIPRPEERERFLN